MMEQRNSRAGRRSGWRDTRVVIVAVVLAVAALVGLCFLSAGLFRAIVQLITDFTGQFV
jgi:predicted lysophospholipase L1 biosynthesis ABC-type transport system permease subunit